MKLVMDEKLKHRLIGLAVIVSLAAIFAPAVMKKSSQRLDHKFSVNVKLPQKPVAPDVVLTDEKEMFKTIKVARVEIKPVPEGRQLTELVKAEPVKSSINTINHNQIENIAKSEQQIKSESMHLAMNEAANHTAKKIIKIASSQSVKQPIPTKLPIKIALKQKAVAKTAIPVQRIKVAHTIPKNTIVKVMKKPVIKKDIYAVQLASFSQMTNAQALVNKLRGKGYKANFVRTSTRQGRAVYKVYVGHSPRKMEVMRLKTQLVSAMQLNGFVVNTGVS